MVRQAIPTLSASGRNGWVLPIWNSLEDNWRPEQVYLTVVEPFEHKGPHLHMKRCGRFICIKGDVLIVQRQTAMASTHRVSGYRYIPAKTGESYGYKLIEVPPGLPVAIYNLRSEPAYVLNLPSPPWMADDPDEWPVEDWSFQP